MNPINLVLNREDGTIVNLSIEKRGLDGLSAYEVAKKDGFVGTEEEWLASLKGEPGRDGTDGKTPIKGTDYWTPSDKAEIVNDTKEAINPLLEEKADKSEVYDKTTVDEKIAQATPSDYDSVKQKVEEFEVKKMEKHLLDYDGTNILEDGEILTFSKLYNILMESEDFCVLVYQNYAYHPNGVSTEQIVFSSSYPVNGLDMNHRITMLKNGTVTKTDATDENVANKTNDIEGNQTSSTKYPSVKGIVDWIKGKLSSLISDVQINGTSIVSGGVADIPFATESESGYGVTHFNGGYGIKVHPTEHYPHINRAQPANINTRNSSYLPIVPANLDYAVKAAMCDGKGADWTEAEQLSARQRIGLDFELINEIVLDTEDKRATNHVLFSNGKYKSVRVIIEAPKDTDTNTTIENGYIFATLNGTGSNFGSINFINKTTDLYQIIDIYANDSFPAYAEFCVATPLFQIANSVAITRSYGSVKVVAPYISTLRTTKNGVETKGKWTLGTKFTVYGIPYVE